MVYLDSIQRVFRQDELSGIIEVRCSPQQQIFLLFIRGDVIEVHKIENGVSSIIHPSQVKDSMGGNEALIRSMNVPEQAVRIAKEILEWYPPTKDFSLKGQALRSYLEDCQAERTHAFLHIVHPHVEGFLLLRDGLPLGSETIFATADGIKTGISHMRQILNSELACHLSLYDYENASTSSEQLRLRIAVMNWSKGLLTRYHQLVGRGLTDTMSVRLSDLMRTNSWSLQVFGDTILDGQVFLTVNQARNAYSLLIHELTDHMIQVIGASMVSRTRNEVFLALDPRDQLVLQEYNLLPAVRL